MPVELETDYLVVGAGATGLAFADEIIRSSKRQTLVMVDEHVCQADIGTTRIPLSLFINQRCITGSIHSPSVEGATTSYRNPSFSVISLAS